MLIFRVRKDILAACVLLGISILLLVTLKPASDLVEASYRTAKMSIYLLLLISSVSYQVILSVIWLYKKLFSLKLHWFIFPFVILPLIGVFLFLGPIIFIAALIAVQALRSTTYYLNHWPSIVYQTASQSGSVISVYQLDHSGHFYVMFPRSYTPFEYAVVLEQKDKPRLILYRQGFSQTSSSICRKYPHVHWEPNNNLEIETTSGIRYININHFSETIIDIDHKTQDSKNSGRLELTSLERKYCGRNDSDQP